MQPTISPVLGVNGAVFALAGTGGLHHRGAVSGPDAFPTAVCRPGDGAGEHLWWGSFTEQQSESRLSGNQLRRHGSEEQKDHVRGHTRDMRAIWGYAAHQQRARPKALLQTPTLRPLLQETAFISLLGQTSRVRNELQKQPLGNCPQNGHTGWPPSLAPTAWIHRGPSQG